MGCHRDTVTRHARAGRFSVVRRLGYGRGKPVRLFRSEVDAFVAAVAKHRDPWEAVRAVQSKANAKCGGGGK